MDKTKCLLFRLDDSEKGREMGDFLAHLVDAPLPNVLVLAGLIFLGIGVVGKVSGKIDPGTTGRITSAMLGAVLVVFGVYTHSSADEARGQPKQTTDSQSTRGQQRLPHPRPPEPSSLFSGVWRNDNPETRGISKLEIQQTGDTVLVRAWATCLPQPCDWGTQKGVFGLNSASITWDQGFVLRKMILTPDAGRLRMVLDSVYRDSRSPRRAEEYFVKGQ